MHVTGVVIILGYSALIAIVSVDIVLLYVVPRRNVLNTYNYEMLF